MTNGARDDQTKIPIPMAIGGYCLSPVACFYAMKRNYSEVKAEIQTGDVLLFSGTGIFSSLIRFSSRSPWSHVGIAYWLGGRLCVFESTTLSKIKDVISGSCIEGVQLVPLSNRVASYEGRVAVRPVECPRGPELLKVFESCTRRFHGVQYEESKLELIKSVYDRLPWLDNKEDLQSLFCSELVAEVFQAVGWLSEDIESNELVPSDFSEEGAHSVDWIEELLGAEFEAQFDLEWDET